MAYKIRVVLKKGDERYYLESINVGTDGSIYSSLSPKVSKNAHFSDHASGKRHLRYFGKIVGPSIGMPLGEDDCILVVSTNLTSSSIEKIGNEKADREVELEDKEIDSQRESHIFIWKVGEHKWASIENSEQPFEKLHLWKKVLIREITPKLVIGIGYPEITQ